MLTLTGGHDKGGWFREARGGGKQRGLSRGGCSVGRRGSRDRLRGARPQLPMGRSGLGQVRGQGPQGCGCGLGWREGLTVAEWGAEMGHTLRPRWVGML